MEFGNQCQLNGVWVGLFAELLFGSEHSLPWIEDKEKVWSLDTQKWMETLQQLAGENFPEIMIRMAKGQLTLYSTKLQIKEPCLRSDLFRLRKGDGSRDEKGALASPNFAR